MLVNTDRYGAIQGKHYLLDRLNKQLILDYNQLKNVPDYTDEEKAGILNSVLENLLLTSTGSERILDQYRQFIDEFRKFIKDLKDFEVFLMTIRVVLLPTNAALENIPNANHAIQYAKAYATSILDELGPTGLSNLIREWDLLTEDICLNKEREIILELYGSIKARLKEEKMDETSTDIVLTAACQEFERRVSQKRKQRAGVDFESAMSFILKYYNIPSAPRPEHFKAALVEVDNWVKDKHGWFIGISLKRTMRERYKQVKTIQEELTKFRIRKIIHIVNNDWDLSVDKIADLGALRHWFFLADESNVLTQYKGHDVVGQYLFPMSILIQKIKELRE